jgi:transposase
MSVAELCRKEGISQSLYYNWAKEFLEAGKARLAGNAKREAGGIEVKEMHSELEQLKLLVAEPSLKNRVLTPALAGGARENSLRGLGDETWND